MPAMTRMSAKSDIKFISEHRKGSTDASDSAGTIRQKSAYSLKSAVSRQIFTTTSIAFSIFGIGKNSCGP